MWESRRGRKTKKQGVREDVRGEGELRVIAENDYRSLQGCRYCLVAQRQTSTEGEKTVRDREVAR